MADKTVTVTTTGPNGEQFTFYSLPEGLADFGSLDDTQKQQLISIMQRATQEGLNSVNYSQFMANENRAQSVTPTARENPPLFSRERISNAWDEATGQVRQMLGSATHGGGPNVAAAGLGFAFGGPVGAAVGYGALKASDMLIHGVNTLFGTNWSTASEAVRDLLEKTGVEAPEGEVMQLFSNMVDASTGAAISVGGMQALANQILAANPLAGGRLLNTLQTLAANPTSQVTGAAGSEVGMHLSNQAADRIDANRAEAGLGPNPWARAGLNFAGGMAGDLLGGMQGNVIDTGVPTRPSQGTIQNAVDSMALEGTTPAQARAAITAGEELGVPVSRSDIFPPQTARQRRWQATLEDTKFGTSGARETQQIARMQAIGTVMNDFGVDTTNLRRNLTPELADSFIEPRQTAWTRYTTQKAQALDSVPPDVNVDTSNTIAYIDDQIERLTAIGGPNADPNTATATSITEGDVRQPNAYQSTINTLKTWRAALQNNTLEGLETNRAEFGNAFIPEGGYGNIRSGLTREIIDGVYDNIRTDITEAVRTYGGDDAARALTEANDGLSDMLGDLSREVVDKFVQRVDSAGRGVNVDPNTPLDRFSEEGYQGARMLIEQSPEMLTELALHGSPSQINTILPYLDHRGEDLMVSVILQGAVRDAAPNIRNVSPDRVADNLDRVIQAVDDIPETLSVRGIELSPERMQRLEGLRRVLDFTRGAEATLKRSSPTNPTQMLSGIPSAQYGAARMMAQNPGVSLPAWLGTIATAGLIGKIYESPAMRDLLLEAATNGLPATRMQQIAREMMRVVSSESFSGETEEQPPNPTEGAPNTVRRVTPLDIRDPRER